MYERHRSDALAFAAGTNGALDVTQTTLSGIGALTTGGATPNILSGSAAMVGGAKSIFNNVAYQRVFVPAILRKTDEARAHWREVIELNRQREHDDYTVDDMLREVMMYHRSGSFYEGVLLLAKDQNDVDTAQRVAETIRSTGPRAATPIELVGAEQPFGVRDRAADGSPIAHPLAVLRNGALVEPSQCYFQIQGCAIADETPSGTAILGFVDKEGRYKPPQAVPTVPVRISVVAKQDVGSLHTSRTIPLSAYARLGGAEISIGGIAKPLLQDQVFTDKSLTPASQQSVGLSAELLDSRTGAEIKGDNVLAWQLLTAEPKGSATLTDGVLKMNPSSDAQEVKLSVRVFAICDPNIYMDYALVAKRN